MCPTAGAEGTEKDKYWQTGPHTRDGELSEEDWRAYVQQFPSNAQFPFEINEIVWIVKPAFRAPLGEFRISKAVLDDKFELIKVSDNTLYPEEVEGKYLRRDPFAITH